MSALLSVSDLSLEFQTRSGVVRALGGVGFEARAGEILGLVGESGSGKSATAHAILGLLGASARVTSGKAEFLGRDLLRLKPAELDAIRGRDAAIVFQSASAALNPVRTVGAQIADVIARHAPAPAAIVRAKTLEALRAMRIADPERRIGAFPHELSGGMRQRIGIAVALACKPQLLIADEPTTGLDVTTQAVVMDLIRDQVRQRGLGVVLITHDLALAWRVCNRIAVMHAGQIVETAARDELFARPRHPCSAALLASLPANAGSLDELGGATPSPLAGEGGAPEGRRGRMLCIRLGMRGRAIGRVLGENENAPVWAEPRLTARPLIRPFGPPSPARGEGVLMASGLTKTFPAGRGRLYAVEGVDLAIAPGEAVGLVGESGCGKSTLARLIARLIDFDRGELKLDGAPIGGISVSRFAASPERARVQMAFQDPAASLNPRFTAFEAIADPVRVLLRPPSRAALAARVFAAAEQVGLASALLSRLPHQLSGGEKARVGLARAMAVEPRLLILDEPTAALDVSVQAMVLQLLARLRREAGVALLFVSHDLHAVRLLCDRVLVMYNGQIVETGPADAVFAAPRHPYMRALVSAMPRIGVVDDGERLHGEPPSPVDPDPRACRFAGRCPAAQERCANEPPPL
ncbi:MAG: ABC transporter ATP-binding protein, partial [Hyphomicrobiales bacterium]|nr:ABC transporter ATP-binding protein [Hyphomicrobiales bacterium]